MNVKARPDRCPCDSGQDYVDCCGRWLESGRPASTAEQLMRSRYCAFVLGDEACLSATWHPSTRPVRICLTSEPPLHWLDLKLLATEAGAPGDKTGTVEFVARYKQAGRAGRLHERSRFVNEGGRWFYVDGDIDE